MHRDQLDKRIAIRGDLAVADAIVQSISKRGGRDRYLRSALSFSEQHIDESIVCKATNRYFDVALAAYRRDEIYLYIEGHKPRFLSEKDAVTGRMKPRLMHGHGQIPYMNLLTGEYERPLGFTKVNRKWLDAIQELVNLEFGLDSPKDHLAEMALSRAEILSRSKGDLFTAPQAVRELKLALWQQIVKGEIRSFEALEAVLQARGVVRVRRGNKPDSYCHVMLPGDRNGANFSEPFFRRDFFQKPADKQLEILREHFAQRTSRAEPKRTRAEYEAIVDDWIRFRSREIKYLHNDSPLGRRYKAASPEERLRILDEAEEAFYRPFGGKNGHLPTAAASAAASFAEGEHEHEHQQQSGSDSRADRAEARATGRRRGRFGEYLPVQFKFAEVGGEVGGEGGEAEVDAAAELANEARWITAADKHVASAGGSPGSREAQPAGGLPGLSGRSVDVVSDEYGDRPRMLLSDNSTPGVDHRAPDSAHGMRRPGARDRRTRAPGRERRIGSDSPAGYYRRELLNERAIRADLANFNEIKRRLDGHRLLAALAVTHGLLPAGYHVAKMPTGDRIVYGTHKWNVSDFLTHGIGLTWPEAEAILKRVYAEQLRNAPLDRARATPDPTLWRQFRVEQAGQEQAAQLKQAIVAKRADLTAAKAAVAAANARTREPQDGPALSKESLRQRRSLLKSEQVVARNRLAVTRSEISALRRQLAAVHKAAYDFDAAYLCWLEQRVREHRDLKALAELRRIDADAPGNGSPSRCGVAPARGTLRVEVLVLALNFRLESGGAVIYQIDGRDAISDRGARVEMLHLDEQTIVTGLQLAIQKFGPHLRLYGTADEKIAIARAAARAGLSVDFGDHGLMMEYRAAMEMHTDTNDEYAAEEEGFKAK